jgi:hypothetical protein
MNFSASLSVTVGAGAVAFELGRFVIFEPVFEVILKPY